MKNSILSFICFMALLLLAGCGHNAAMTGVGKVFKIGNESLSILYVNGLFTMAGTRENVETTVETNDNDALGNPADVKAVRTIRYKVGPQINGYTKDLAKVCPDAAIEYVKTMPKINSAQLQPVKTETSKESSKISKSFTTVIKEKLAKLVTGDDYKSPLSKNCELTDLDKDESVAYQAALCADLLTYADDTTEMPSGDETIKEALVHYAGRLAQLKAKGIEKATKITLRKATIKDGKLTYLMFRLKEDDGTYRDEECPNCFELEQK